MSDSGSVSATRVLVVVDHTLLAETVALTLNHGLFDLQVAENADSAAQAITEWRPHLAIIDMDLGGAELLSKLGIGSHSEHANIPVIGMTRRGDLRTKLAAFDQGVDDIMTVPFSPEELLARTVAMTRRAYGTSPDIKPVIRVGDIEIDILNRDVRAGTSVIHLTSLEQNLLYLLVASSGRVIVCAAIDNLGKGAAGQAVQCANLLLGLPETTIVGQGGPAKPTPPSPAAPAVDEAVKKQQDSWPNSTRSPTS